jgi:hypothetical protein
MLCNQTVVFITLVAFLIVVSLCLLKLKKRVHKSSSLSICRRLYPEDRIVNRQEILQMIQTQDRPVFVRDTTASGSAKWSQLSMKKVANMFRDYNIEMRLMVTPTGVVGWYDSTKVNTYVDPISLEIWGKVKENEKGLDQAPFRMQHIQHDYDPTNLNFYIDADANSNKTNFYISPNERYYFRTLECQKFLTVLKDAIPPNIPLEEAVVDNVNFYISGRNIITNLHVDGRSGIIVQLKGRKRVYVFPRSELKHANMYPPNHALNRRSRIDGKLTEAIVQATSLRNAKGYQMILEPGTWLYIPSIWMHYVETLDPETYSIIIRFKK